MSTLLLLNHIIARGGGGGSGGGGGGGGGLLILPFIIIGAIIAWWRRRKQIKIAKKELASAEASDSTWDTAQERAKHVFSQFEQDWSEFNVPNMKSYLTESYFEHISMMMEALRQMNRQNRMSSVTLDQANIFNVSDSDVNTLDSFDIEIKASAKDMLVDLNDNEALFVDDKNFTEIWHFARVNDQWMLDQINQADIESSIESGYFSKTSQQGADLESSRMRSFAAQNNFFYNADFGWLLLPNNGLLFTLSNFGRSDINYHVIGKYHDVLVQFYQYIPVVPDKRKLLDYFKSIYKPAYRYNPYVVAQTILPKTYGDIVVKRKGGLGLSFVPSNMTKVTLEGLDFNKDYLVYATDMEKVTSLELLNPAYMQQLIDTPFKINMEIVDNVLYLYSTDENADFNIMLNLIHTAFKEMKM